MTIKTSASYRYALGLLAAVGFSLLLCKVGNVAAADFYVSNAGSDENNGSIDQPFASLIHARDMARKSSATDTIWLRSGRYFLPQGMDLGVEDSNTTWQAFENETPVITGGVKVDGWKPWRDGIYQADVSSLGNLAIKQLLYDGQRQWLARYPNFDSENPYGAGWAYVDGELINKYSDRDEDSKRSFVTKSEDWRSWAHPEDVSVFIFARYNWWNDIMPVATAEQETNRITTTQDASYAIRPGDRYYFQGALEDLDTEGEWHFDSREKRLFFKPPRNTKSSVLVPTTRVIVRINKDAHDIELRGLTLECAEGNAVAMTEAKRCRVVASVVRSVGDYHGSGISIKNGTQCEVVGCDISFTGSHGVQVSGGDIKTLTSPGHRVDNCYIHHAGVFHKQGVGVMLSGVGHQVSHCLIHDMPRFAVMFWGNKHQIEKNHMRHLALETEDVGATYTGGRNWISSRGTTLKHNLIHDVLGYGWDGSKWSSPYFAFGIYLDDNTGGVDVIGNIVARCGRSGLHGHSARDNRIEGNIFADNADQQWEFNGWKAGEGRWAEHYDEMVAGYESVVGLPAWKNMRGMDVHPKDIADEQKWVVSGNVFRSNIIAWKNEDAKAMKITAFSPTRNEVDKNLYWHDGREVTTGHHALGRQKSKNLIANPTLKGNLGALPDQWNWQIQTSTSSAELVDDNGDQVLRIGAGYDSSKARDNYPIIASDSLPLRSGASYRLRATMRSDTEASKANLLVQSYVPAKDGMPAHFWGQFPSEVNVSRQWETKETIIRIPAEGEKGWNERMGEAYRVRIDWGQSQGNLFVRDIELVEMEPMSEWASWQSLGFDQNSIIADPKFADRTNDDYRLPSDSPAFQLGFQAIPVDEIGPYESPDRVTWPIEEAEGAREHPLTP
ncbi:hypothetical protein Pla22_00930 [Rubripirellula amarantea]|uniref:Right handed beta helix domain-containing protein n=1 Tax=Rubripirellula amarantea TaxID=2527999 RepID=A0A5C5WQN8_9BACT|nr:right-handed parallel beta-helix repeat-containing protein [Rubripirellula amarantea]TWT52469.1 hypothetical protein Pla22_00930 [Rubripirellula amarantea]